MIYEVYIKSHSHASDYEDTVEAATREEAYDKFCRATPALRDFSKAYVLERIHSEEENI